MRRGLLLLAALALLFNLCWLSLVSGAVPIAPSRVIGGLTDPTSSAYFIVHQVRLPRMLVAVWAGCGLAVAGAVLQSLLRNPLSSPDVIGITQGASFAAAAAIYLLPGATAGALPLYAFTGAMLSFLILILISRQLTLSPASLALSGVAIGAVFQAGIQYFMVTNPTNINMALLWMTGSLWGRGWDQVPPLVVPITIMSVIALMNARKLDILQLGDALSQSLGMLVRRERLWLLLLSVAMAGVSVSAVGAIGFIGLLAPHMARVLVGTRNRWRLPMAAAIGADLMLLGDLLGRTLIVPREIPVGIVTAIIGAPYFIFLLRRERRLKGMA
ncbi:FecCD family ABC transporter permease [Cohnella hashimotonis]|uniref:Iron ABC transporter permease n=1 Tax=Cohnella hashimotonis TaxID=2826895 RepID=A0ABT6TS66_9BACL|nr:iron ABC transporter permease [Cohnella hashimotonis]MDI4649699.1 iron ABC transporter permease [Cohnella hashimotonis]